MMFFDDRLAMPGIYGGSVAEAVRLGARPVKLDLSIVLGARRRRHQPHRPGRHLLDDLLLAVPRRPHLRHPRPPHRRPGGLERRHLGQRQRGAELRRRAAPRPRRALRPRRRVPRGHHRPVGHVGGRRPRARPGGRHLRRPRQGPRARLRGRVVQGARAAHRAPLAPGPPGAAPGRLVGPRPRLRRPVGRADLHRRPRHRRRPVALQGPEGAHRPSRPRPDVGEDAADGLHGGGRVAGARRGARAAVPQRPGRPDGVAHAAVRADELRLLVARPRRPDHRRADRVGVGHPRAWCRTCASTSAATVTLADLAGHRATLLQGPRFVGTGAEVADQMEEWFDDRRLRRLRHRRHPLARRLRGRRAPGRARAPAPRRVPRPLHRRHAARAPRPRAPGRRPTRD